jgi:hypothetical protein
MSDIAIRPSADVIATIEVLHRDLARVRSVVDILGSAAADKIKAIEEDIAAANLELTEALTAEALEARNKLIASFSDISITTSRPLYDDNLSCVSFSITYERLTYSMAERASIPTRYTCNGFDALPDEAYDYLLEVRPEVIPVEIMALAPGKPREAFARYFQAQRRGYLVG